MVSKEVYAEYDKAMKETMETKEIDEFIKKMSDTTQMQTMQHGRVNPLTLYASIFRGDDGVKKGLIYTHRPSKKILKYQTFITDKSGSAVDKVVDFMQRNGVTEYKNVEV